MKEWKVKIAQRIIDEWKSDKVITFCGFKTDRAVKFQDVAHDMGYKHIIVGDIRDIAIKVHEMEPKLHGIRLVNDPKHILPTEGRFATIYFTDLELDSGDESIEATDVR